MSPPLSTLSLYVTIVTKIGEATPTMASGDNAHNFNFMCELEIPIPISASFNFLRYKLIIIVSLLETKHLSKCDRICKKVH